MKQARISAAETPGEVNFSLETLIRIASAFRVGLKVEFVPYSEMLKWERDFSQDSFDVPPLESDDAFISPRPHGTVQTTSFHQNNAKRIDLLTTTTPEMTSPDLYMAGSNSSVRYPDSDYVREEA